MVDLEPTCTQIVTACLIPTLIPSEILTVLRANFHVTRMTCVNLASQIIRDRPIKSAYTWAVWERGGRAKVQGHGEVEGEKHQERSETGEVQGGERKQSAWVKDELEVHGQREMKSVGKYLWDFVWQVAQIGRLKQTAWDVGAGRFEDSLWG